MNNEELRKKVHAAMYEAIRDKGVAAPVDILMAIGVLRREDYENWRRGRVPYLEKVCQCNLSKLSSIMREMRMFAQKNKLKPSWTAYNQWGQKKKIRLRFSKSGNEQIEKNYATSFVSPEKVAAAKQRRAEKQDE